MDVQVQDKDKRGVAALRPERMARARQLDKRQVKTVGFQYLLICRFYARYIHGSETYAWHLDQPRLSPIIQ